LNIIDLIKRTLSYLGTNHSIIVLINHLYLYVFAVLIAFISSRVDKLISETVPLTLFWAGNIAQIVWKVIMFAVDTRVSFVIVYIRIPTVIITLIIFILTISPHKPYASIILWATTQAGIIIPITISIITCHI
jgi:hypothetical protein